MVQKVIAAALYALAEVVAIDAAGSLPQLSTAVPATAIARGTNVTGSAGSAVRTHLHTSVAGEVVAARASRTIPLRVAISAPVHPSLGRAAVGTTAHAGATRRACTARATVAGLDHALLAAEVVVRAARAAVTV